MGDLTYNFSRSEFSCKDECGFETVDYDLLKALEHVRGKFNKPITINSACRCENHNASVGGSKNSKHMQGIAADFVVKDVDPSVVYSYLIGIYPLKYGIGKYGTFTHLDVRADKARWAG